MKIDWDKDIEEVRNKYPLLNINHNGAQPRIYGEIELTHPVNGRYIDIFNVEIVYTKYFPFMFPHVYELDGDIPRTVERHVMPKSGRLCLAIEFEEYMLCKKGISTVWFIDRILVPRLAEEHTINNGGKYSREYSHNPIAAQWEFFMKLFDTKSSEKVIGFLNRIVNRKIPKGDRPCFCESGLSYNKCHKKSIVMLQQLKIETLSGIKDELLTNPYPSKA